LADAFLLSLAQMKFFLLFYFSSANHKTNKKSETIDRPGSLIS